MKISFLSGSNVDRLQKQYCISEHFQLFASDPDGRMSSPPPDQVIIYMEDFLADLRFSISKFVQNFFDYYCLYPAQLAPNSIRLIISFALLCRLIPTNPQPSLFRTFFVLYPHPKAKGCGSLTQERVYLLFLVFFHLFTGGRSIFFISSLSSWGFSSS